MGRLTCTPSTMVVMTRLRYTETQMNLTKKIAIVTGGSSGIGRAIAESLISAGSHVTITGRDQAKLEAAAAEIGAQAVRADVSNEQDVKRTYLTVLESSAISTFWLTMLASASLSRWLIWTWQASSESLLRM